MTEHADILIVGGVAAGTSAAARLKRLRPDWSILLLEKSSTISYGTCELPYIVSGEIPDPESIVFFDAETFEKNKGVKVKLHAEVTDADFSRKVIRYRHGLYQSYHEVTYRKALISTGSTPNRIPFLEGPNTFYLKTMDSARSVIRYMQSTPVQSVLIIGGGYIGVELAESMHRLGKNVTVIEKQNHLFGGSLSTKMSETICSLLEQNGVNVSTSAQVISCIGGNGQSVKSVTLSNGQNIETDMVFVSTGFTPATTFLKNIKKAKNGAIITNPSMETSVNDIYAAGDCATIPSVFNRHDYLPLANLASRSGRIAAASMAGQMEKMKPVSGTIAVRVFNYELAHTGLKWTQLSQLKRPFEVTSISGHNKVYLFEDAGPISVEIAWDRQSGRVLSGSILGHSGSALRINPIALAIQNDLSIDDLYQADFLYTPPLSPLWDPVTLASKKKG